MNDLARATADYYRRLGPMRTVWSHYLESLAMELQSELSWEHAWYTFWKTDCGGLIYMWNKDVVNVPTMEMLTPR